ncbi:hypothetical protein [Staphylococcus phage PT1-4]
MIEQGVFFENIDLSSIHWYSDFNGDEVGYPYSNVVGYYTYYDLNMYIDMETLNVLELWFDEEEEN